MGIGRNWTTEEDEFLAENWGQRSIKRIAEALNRSENAIVCRKNKLGLGAFLDSGGYITLNQLMLAIKGTSVSSYDLTSWIKNRSLPVKHKRVGNSSFRVIYLDDFWPWAEKNASFLDFSKFEKNVLGKEPEWVAAKRRADCIREYHIKKSPWTPSEDDKLKHLLEQQRYGYAEIAHELRRTEGAIVRRINDLGLKFRAVKADNHQLWTPEDLAQLTAGIKSMESYEQIHLRIPHKSTKAIRGRVYNSYLTERLDLVRDMIGDGDFGDNKPEKMIRHFRLMPPNERAALKNTLSLLAGELLQVARMKSGVSKEFADYWQKDLCLNWNDVLGCTAGETCCDSCTAFCRIREQYCKRCGASVLSRSQITFCSSCLAARKKAAQKKWAVLNLKSRNVS